VTSSFVDKGHTPSPYRASRADLPEEIAAIKACQEGGVFDPKDSAILANFKLAQFQPKTFKEEKI
jgi:hypothetical protein